MKADLLISKITNLANGVAIHKSATQGLCELIEFDETKIGIQLLKPLGKGLLIIIESQLHIGKERFSFEITGKVHNVIVLEDKHYYIVVELHHFDKSLWSRFMGHHKEASDRAEELFRKLRGEE